MLNPLSTSAHSPVLTEAGRAIQVDPQRAEKLIRMILADEPANETASLMLIEALRAQRLPNQAHPLAAKLAIQFPTWAAAQYQLGAALTELGRPSEGLPYLLVARGIKPELPGLIRTLGDAQLAAGDAAAAANTYVDYLKAPAPESWIVEAQQSIGRDDWRDAEAIVRARLVDHPQDVLALMMLGDVALAYAKWAVARDLYIEVLKVAPAWIPARCAHAMVQLHLDQHDEGLTELEAVLAEAPDCHDSLNLKAAALSQDGEFAAALSIYDHMVQLRPDDPVGWMCRGNMLRILGRREDCITCYRKSTEIRATYGEGYWSLANLKRYAFTEAERQRMSEALGSRDLTDSDRTHLMFAMAKACDDAGNHKAAFSNYAAANSLWRGNAPDETEIYTRYGTRCRNLFTPEFFAARQNSGIEAFDPIFVVGMPRSGSTLVEQVLASHSAVEGTMELTKILRIVRRLSGGERGIESADYPGLLTGIDREGLRMLGEEYLSGTQIYRKLGRSRFIDKAPSNFLHCGLIHLILPKARIVDVRRHPLACGWSNFKQHFARGQLFTYDLAELGAYYSEYVKLMAHFDAVLPGRVHRVYYERLVADPEIEIRRLLEHCGLPFESQCLRSHETERPVWTPSSQQVRQPIYTTALDDWRAYEGWLGPLKKALGEVVTNYPGENS